MTFMLHMRASHMQVVPDLYPGPDIHALAAVLKRDSDDGFAVHSLEDRDALRKDPPDKDLDRSFIRITKKEDSEKDQESLRNEFLEAMETGNVVLAVEFLVVYFGKGMTEPFVIDYIEHVKSRCRIARKMAVVGYSNSCDSLARAESLAIRRADRIRDTLVNAKVKPKVVTVARPNAMQLNDERYNRRVVVTGLYPHFTGNLVEESGGDGSLSVTVRKDEGISADSDMDVTVARLDFLKPAKGKKKTIQ